MAQIKIVYVAAVEVDKDTFAVDAKAVDGTWFRHEGPKDFPYFTSHQAQRLEWKVKVAQTINSEHWVNGTGGYYGSDDYEYVILEREYFERVA